MVDNPRVSVSAETSIRNSVAEDIDLWTGLGLGHVGLLATKFSDDDWDSVAKRVTEAGLRVGNIGTWLGDVPRCLEIAGSLGATCVWTVTGGPVSRHWDEAVAAFCETVAPARLIAERLGVALAIEPTPPVRCENSFIFNLRDTIDLARAAGLGVVLDFALCWCERGLDELVRDNIDILSLVQINDWAYGAYDSPNRCVIGDGNIPVEELLSVVIDAGYLGAFDLELLGPKIEAEGYPSVIRRSLDRTNEILERLGV